MKTDALIEALAKDITPVEAPRTGARFAAAAVLGAVLAGLVVAALFGRSFTWRGIRYRLNGANDVKRLE